MNVNLIRVTLEYHGACRIPRGEYAADDPALHGLAPMLITNGHAVVIGTVERADPPKVSTNVDAGTPPTKPMSPIAHKSPARKRRT